ncbi:MBL fold metallo-hydrolase [Paenarthrobacter nitroguajacolicus]|uniref:MBL fold metallo-hydrolase n=1 Tax=Paenarthrobacter nitroguajacolicus TaxID=211146 RepID=UPI003ADD5F50
MDRHQPGEGDFNAGRYSVSSLGSRIPTRSHCPASHLPAGIAGPTEISFDVRCFVLPASSGIVVIDTGMRGSAVDMQQALERLGAGWGDVSDIVLTHSHADHGRYGRCTFEHGQCCGVGRRSGHPRLAFPCGCPARGGW